MTAAMLLTILILQIIIVALYVATGVASMVYLRRSERRSVADQVAHERRMAAMDNAACGPGVPRPVRPVKR